MPHYSEYNTFSEAFVGFSDYARDEGLNVGIDETIYTLHSAFYGLWKDEPFFRYALATICCARKDDRAVFELIYNRYWSEKGTEFSYRARLKNRSNLEKKTKGTLVMLGQHSDQNNDAPQNKTTSGSNSLEALRTTDFSLISHIDEEAFNNICQQLVREMTLRIKRKYKRGKRNQVDIVRTIRHGIPLGGNFAKIYHKEKRREKLRLVLLLDVSGSMDKYSFYLLKFIWVLRQHFSQIEAFTFSTQLKQITESLNHKTLQVTLNALSHEADHWSSGTKIGQCLKEFVDKFGKRILNGRTMTIILSDGLETGEPSLLEQQLKRIKMRTKKLIWLNPLKGSELYQPIQRGMQAALPHLDVFQAAHNLESLLTLEKIMANA
ncbi:MAG: VWA domain-containing protein [Saprospiraceae bacterium]|nr:VWA domain-containing protein [Saprospiraceae bacterium]